MDTGNGNSNDTPPPCAHPTNCYYPPLEFYEGLIFLTPILFTIIMIMVLCSVYFRRQRERGGMVTRSLRSVSSRNPFFTSTSHPAGLDKAVRESFNCFTYIDKSSLDIIKGDEQCAVCLGDYQQNEKLKQLPGCLHAFHCNCIDLWLESNTTCPLCRVSLLPGSPPPQADATSPSQMVETAVNIPESTGTVSSSLQTARLLANLSADENRHPPHEAPSVELATRPQTDPNSATAESTALASHSVAIDVPTPNQAAPPSPNGSAPGHSNPTPSRDSTVTSSRLRSLASLGQVFSMTLGMGMSHTRLESRPGSTGQ